MSLLSTLNRNHCIWPLTSLIFSFDLIRNLIPDYCFSDVLKVTGRVLRCVNLERERKEMGGNYRGTLEREGRCALRKEKRRTMKNQSATRQRRAGREKEGICTRDGDRGTDRRKGRGIAGGGRLAAVRGRVVYFLKIQIFACTGHASRLPRWTGLS